MGPVLSAGFLKVAFKNVICLQERNRDKRLVSVECTRGPTHSWQHVPGSGSSQTVTGTGLHRASRGR